MALDPVIGGALIKGGSQLLGNILGGIGGSLTASQQARIARENEEQRRLEAQQALQQRQMEFGRTAGFTGLQTLADQRQRALGQARSQSFKNALLGAVNG